MKNIDKLNPGEIFVTFVDTEGMQSGFDINVVKEIKKHIKSNLVVNGGLKDFKEIIQADEITFIMKPIKEIRKASVNSGIQLIKCVSEFVKDNDIFNEYQKAIKEKKVHGIFPVAFAICCNALQIRKEKSLTMLLYGFTVSVIGAALRLGLIQHLEGQKIIHEIKPIIIKTLKENSNKSLFDMWQFAPQFDIIQMSHEKMDSKMFIT